MTHERPDPDQLLQKVMADEQRACQGRLKIFLGYASRVGKTSRMLEEMLRRRRRHQDVVVGWVQDINSQVVRQTLLEIEVVPPTLVTNVPEMDVEAILRRKPQVCLVDELAHTNSPGSRNDMRWQDVEEIRKAGINVVTAVNVQYLEGLQEQIRELLGSAKSEHVPDRIIREADEVVLVDVSAAEVRDRLADGGRSGLDYRKLSSLREMALLYTADTVDKSVEDYRHEHHIDTIWGTHERILVCITAHGRGPDLVERGRRAAERLHAELFVMYVTPDPEWSNLSAEQRTFIQSTMALARTYQATVEAVVSTKPASAIIEYAKAHHITQIFIGHTLQRRFPKLLSQSTVGRIIRGADGIDVHVASDHNPLPSISLPQTSSDLDCLPKPAEVVHPGRGRLKVFLGYAAGVGKTYQMLNEGNELLKKGHDVVIGYFEPHGREDTIAQIGGLPMVPRRTMEYRGKNFEEMDLHGILQRHPEYCMVDELAHTNVPGCENEKRWQDVLRLLEANIHVLGTVNVQHLESLNDRISQITGVRVRETVPDWVVQQADEIVLVDVSTRALMHRLERGVVYPPEKAAAALENFFREGNLAALRELAMRQTAEAVEYEMETKVDTSRLTRALESVMVCLNEHPSGASLVRRSKQVADRLHAECFAVHVAPDATWYDRMPEERKVVEAHFNLARSLNLHCELIYGKDVARSLVKFAKEHGVGQIFMGRSLRCGWRELLFRNIIEQVIREAPDIDIHVVAER